MKPDMTALMAYGNEKIRQYQLDFYEYKNFGRLALVELGIAPFNFVSACLAMASMFYFREVVFVHEAFPLNQF